MIPDPVYNFEAATWIYAALGDAYFFLKEYVKAIDMFNQALKCSNGIGNSFICLRLGQCYAEINNIEMSQNYLIEAYMLEGKKIFQFDKDGQMG